MGLFVYGTLHPDRAPAEIHTTVQMLAFRSKAWVEGVIYNLEEYPALLLSGTGQTAPGEVFHLPEDPGVLAALDAYEGFDPASPGTSLFVRRTCDVLFADGHTEPHWVYVYNRELPQNAAPLVDGSPRTGEAL